MASGISSEKEQIMFVQKLVIKNIGQILSGKLEEPLIDGDCVIAIHSMQES